MCITGYWVTWFSSIHLYSKKHKLVTKFHVCHYKKVENSQHVDFLSTELQIAPLVCTQFHNFLFLDHPPGVVKLFPLHFSRITGP